jgi:hypothetical protein
MYSMNLSDIYKEGGFGALKRLAEITGNDPQYLRQIATGWRGKRPSPELAMRLIEADPRLTLAELFGHKTELPKDAA